MGQHGRAEILPLDLAHLAQTWLFYFPDNFNLTHDYVGFPGGSEGKESVCSAGDLGSIPGLGRSPGEANGNPLQYFCLENPMDRETWWATVRGVTKSWTQLND